MDSAWKCIENNLPLRVLKNKYNRYDLSARSKYINQRFAYREFIKILASYHDTYVGMVMVNDVLHELRFKVTNTNDEIVKVRLYRQIRLVREHALDLLRGKYIYRSHYKTVSFIFDNLIEIIKYKANIDINQLTDYKPYLKRKTYQTYAQVRKDMDNVSDDVTNFSAVNLDIELKCRIKHLKDFINTLSDEYGQDMK